MPSLILCGRKGGIRRETSCFQVKQIKRVKEGLPLEQSELGHTLMSIKTVCIAPSQKQRHRIAQSKAPVRGHFDPGLIAKTADDFVYQSQVRARKRRYKAAEMIFHTALGPADTCIFRS
jgi:hypothetical protein